jgi:hypothetical protein
MLVSHQNVQLTQQIGARMQRIMGISYKESYQIIGQGYLSSLREHHKGGGNSPTTVSFVSREGAVECSWIMWKCRWVVYGPTIPLAKIVVKTTQLLQLSIVVAAGM